MSYQDAIPIEWRKKLKQKHLSVTYTPNQKDKILISDDLTPLTKLTHKSVYLELTSKINSVPTAQKRFINDYHNANLIGKSIYELPLKVTVEIRTRQFQYKLFHRTLYFNKALFKMNIADTNKCTFCNDSDETIAHVMFQCTHSLSFWNDVVDWLKEFKIYLGILNEFNVLFGLFIVNHFKLTNHVVLIGKQTIYTCRAKKVKPNLNIFLAKLRNTLMIEQNIAQRRGALESFYFKWDNLVSWLQI